MTKQITELRRQNAELRKRSTIEDGPCYYCGQKTNSLAANPSLWPVFLCHADDPGRCKHHHMGCIDSRLAQNAELREALAQAVGLLNAWGPGPADELWIKDVADPLLRKTLAAQPEGGAK